MASVWYIGRSDVRTISEADWTAVGAPGPTSTWSAENGWSIPRTDFTTEQLFVLEADPSSFNTDAPDGSRPGPAAIAFPDPYPDYVQNAELDAAVATLTANEQSSLRAALMATYAWKGEALLGASVPAIEKYRPGTLSAPLTTPTYDGSGDAVHPSVCYFPHGWAGRRYWMAMTPYPASDPEFENPSILVSDDGNTWSVPAGVTNPLVPSPPGLGFNSDPHLTPGPDGLLYLFYREFLDVEQRERINVLSSSDGITWTAPVNIIDTPRTTQRVVSPAVWWDGGAQQWVMLGVDIVSSTAVVKRFTSASATAGWSAGTIVPVTPAWDSGRAPWHLDAHNLGGTVVALIQDGSSAGGDLYLATSTDQGRTVKRSTTMAAVAAYRSCFVPILAQDGLVFDTFVGHLNGTINRTTLAPTRKAENLLAAVMGIAPYVLGDTFARADSATSLGAASSGQTYTMWAGTAGISGGAGYAAVAGNTKAVINTGIADGTATLDFPAVDSQGWLIFRGTDTNNYWRVGYNVGSAQYRLEKVVAGAATAVATLSRTAQPGDTVEVTYSGSSITATVNGGLHTIGTASDAFNQTATLVGWQGSTVAARFDNLTCRA